jgi:subtilase family serine protease
MIWKRKKKFMQPFFTFASRALPTQLAAGAAKLRRVWIVILGGLVSPGIAYGGTFAQLATDVSPLVAQSKLISPTDPNQEISVVLVVPLKDANGATEFAERVSKPGDELFGQFITPAEFAARYGADEYDYSFVKNWAKDNQLKITDESVGRTTLTVTGKVSQFEALFNVQLNNYRSPNGDEFYSASTAPIIPSRIAGQIMAVVGLSSSIHYAPLSKIYRRLGENPLPAMKADTAGGSGPGGAFNTDDLRDAYNRPDLHGTVLQKVALFEQGGYAQTDIDKYIANNRLPNVLVKPRLVNGYKGGVNDPNIELEAVLDVDMIMAMNPAVNEVLVYEDGKDSFDVALLDALADVASDNAVQTFSISYGQDERQAGAKRMDAENQIFVQLAAQGVTVFVSSGDNGAYGDTGIGYNASDPGAQPLITSVGGTTLFTGKDASYGDEEAWNLLVSGLGATGGGVSAHWTIPNWQPPSEVTPNGGSATYRNFPDVAAVGNPETGVAVYSGINGGWIQVGGTSVAAPLWAGYISLLNSALQTVGFPRLGFLNAAFYPFANQYYGEYGILHDVFDGTNGNSTEYRDLPGYSAGLGYDNCTGWGSMNGQGFAAAWLLTPIKEGQKPGEAGGLKGTALSTTAKLSWDPANGATGYLVEADPPNDALPLNFVSKGTSTEITGLMPRTTYRIVVFALNESGNTVIKNQIMLTTK